MKLSDLKPGQKCLLTKNVGELKTSMKIEVLFAKDANFVKVSCPELIPTPFVLYSGRECRLVTYHKRYRKHRRKYVQK